MRDVGVIIAAAGSGSRFGKVKQFELLGDLALYQYVARTFSSIESIRALVLVGREEEVPTYEAGLRELKLECECHVVSGGATRQESVAKGLDVFRAFDGIEVLLVHDAARALVNPPLIEAVIRAVREHGSAIPGLPVVDTLKRTDGQRIIETVSRENLWRAQTPQGARLELMLGAYDVAPDILRTATDEAQLLERIGEHPWIVPGSESNFKITYPADLERARSVLANASQID
ncbi:MAG: 2-C-methyl-D-erythritol 4-phosphate cytidylyltransferase [Bacteroidota bacterium]|nr:2-C-methyl-D-erythritol 4-phosphate cytidylyltransferase [Bacteroidota bacterium]MDP4233264.1 2-C-methyl-D-erythritol 4-phosphate cytidylyltransferase [Bacteroidota bacterium]MDP4242116.1 2-C-methyl-D-erythritol 4-phosphate cytidylyltransferase [Bacteroidota bacterium]MDP4289085.1 2-C-methyl-D-erythritol 4-phosphate cytidylyltransferase [Bacteroidota bacterium]